MREKYVSNEPTLFALVKELAAQAPLAADDRDAILALPLKRRDVAASTYIVCEGEQTTSCSILIDGFAYRHKLSGDGARQILSLQLPGEALDFQNVFLPYADHNVQALTACTLAVVPRSALIDIVRTRPAVAHAILIAALVEASIFREWILNVGRRDARARVAHLLCEFATRMDAHGLSQGGAYSLPMTQEQIGDATGLTAVHVNRTIKALEADGLIQRHGRSISFPDLASLRDVGGFSSLYLHTAVE